MSTDIGGIHFIVRKLNHFFCLNMLRKHLTAKAKRLRIINIYRFYHDIDPKAHINLSQYSIILYLDT